MLATSSLYQKGDRQLLLYIFILIITGIIILTSASGPLAYAKFNHDSYFFIKKQLVNGFLPGIVLFLLFSKINYQIWKKMGWGLYGISLVLLCLVFVNGVGLVLNGSKSWIELGGFTFQPAELAKLSIIVVLSLLLIDKRRDWSNWQTSLLPVLAILSPVFILILLQPDLGTLSILLLTTFALLYIARIPKHYLITLGALSLVAFIAMISVASYRVDRLNTFLHPELDPTGKGYQVNQAKLAIGSGGFWGLGIGHSRQKFQYLPEVHADSIFAIFAEEMGFIISLGFIILILLIGSRGLKIANATKDEFGKLLASGIVIWLMWQSFLNIGGIMNALPLTGVPLPLMSHGGSAYMTMLAALGIVLNISKQRVS